ncbi:MAG: hypothetical protein LBL00_03340, partial [Endomicrobium sp.]|nr:hypothetical protein [Endomicrobium sp.]
HFLKGVDGDNVSGRGICRMRKVLNFMFNIRSGLIHVRRKIKTSLVKVDARLRTSGMTNSILEIPICVFIIL